MTKILGGLLIAVGLLLFDSIASAQQSLRWEPTLEQAQRIAAQTNRLVLVHFTANWCVVCKQMEADVLTNPAITTALAANYVAVKVNVDHFPSTAQRFGVTGLPTTVILSPQGQVLDNMRGRVAADQYLARLTTAAANMHQGNTAMYAQIPTQQPAASGQPVANAAVPPANVANAAPVNPGTPATTDGRYADFYRRGQAATGAVPGGAAATTPQPYTSSTPYSNSPNYAAQPPMAATAPPTAGPALGYAQPQANANTAVQPAPGAVAQAYPQMPAPIANPTVTQPAVVANPAPAYGAQRPAQPAQTQTPYVASNSVGMPAYNGQPSANLVSNQPNASLTMPTLPPGSPPLGLEGFCPVSLVEKQAWVPGDRRWGAIHRGRTYLFASPEEQRRFFTDPDRYSPILAGNDVVLAADQNEAVPGLRRHGVYCDNRIYLFSSEATLEKFARNPTLYTNKAKEAMRAGGNPTGQVR